MSGLYFEDFYVGRQFATEPVILNEATHEIPRQTLSCEKARRVLDWSSAYSLTDGLRETITWYAKRSECQPNDA